MRYLCRKLEKSLLAHMEYNNPMGHGCVWAMLFAPSPPSPLPPFSIVPVQGQPTSLGYSISCPECSVGFIFHGCLSPAGSSGSVCVSHTLLLSAYCTDTYRLQGTLTCTDPSQPSLWDLGTCSLAQYG